MHKKKKGNGNERRPIGLYKVSGTVFFQTTILYTIATFQIFFLVLLVILSPPFPIEVAVILLDRDLKVYVGMTVDIYIYSHSLSLSFFLALYIRKTYTSFFTVHEDKNSIDNYSFFVSFSFFGEICIFFFLSFSFNQINDDKWLTIDWVYICLHDFVVLIICILLQLLLLVLNDSFLSFFFSSSFFVDDESVSIIYTVCF